MKKFTLYFKHTILCFLILSSTKVFSQGAPACPDINAGPDQTICPSVCATMSTTVVSSYSTTSYSVASIPNSPYPYTGGTGVSVNTDDVWSNVINLPFNFCYFGNTYNKCILGSNGQLCFNTSLAGGYDSYPVNTALPSTANMPGNTISAVFRDIDPSVSGSMAYYLTGTAPCRALVVYWKDIALYSCNTPHSTFQLVLYENTNYIDVYVNNSAGTCFWQNGKGIIGIQNAAATVAVTPPGRNATAWTSTGEAWRFSPTGAPSYVVNWTIPPSTTIIATGLSPQFCPTVTTNYLATMTLTNCDGNTFNRTDNINVIVNPVPPPTVSPVSYCNGATASPLSATGTNLLWYTTATGGTGTPTAPTPSTSTVGTTTYYVSQTIGSCEGLRSPLIVTIKPPPTANAGPDQVLTCTLTSLNLDGSGSTSGNNYGWTGGTITSGGATTTPTVNATGTYTLTVTDPSTGCSATDNVVVTLNNTPPNVNAGADQILTCSSTQVTLSGSSSTPGATYNWTGGIIVSGGTTANPTVNGAATYTLTVTNPTNGCTATDNVAVTTVVNTPNVNAGTDMILTCTTTQVTLNGSSSTTGATFNWTGGTIVSGGTTSNPIVSAAGTYTLTVTDLGSGCTATDNVSVTLNNTPPNVNAGTDMVLTCTTTQVTLNGSSSTTGATFNWTGGTIVSGGTTATPTVSVAGTYTLTVTNPTNGCTATDIASVTLNNTPPNVNAGSDQTLTCTTTQVTLNGSSSTTGTTFNWTGGTIVSGDTTANPIVNAAGTYTLTVTDPTNGCTSTDAAIVNSAVGTPNIDAGADQILTCTTTSITLNGSSNTSGAIFNWSGGAIVSGGTTATPIVNSTGTYTLTVTDPLNGCTATDVANVTLNNTPPNVNAGADQILTCTITSITLNGSSSTSGATFNWTGGTIVSGGTTTTPTVSAAGTYTLTVTDPMNGCTDTDNAVVNLDNTPPPVNAGSDQTVCQGTLVTLVGSGSVGNYTWNNGVVNNISFVISATTTYTVTGTGANGCTNTDDITVNVVPTPILDFNGDKLSGCSPLTTQFTNNSTGNLVGCQWTFSNGDNVTGCGGITETFVNVGCYDVTLTVNTPEGCTNTLTRTNYVCVVPNPVADFNINPDHLTTVDANADMVNTTTGGYTYVWNFGDNSGISTELSPNHSFPDDKSGTYKVTLYATSIDGCKDSTSRTIQVIDDLIYYVPNTFTPDNDDYNETFLPIFTSGFDPYDYTLLIFDRWGSILFESHNAKVGWDGTFGGKIVIDGTYLWKIMFKLKDNDKHEIIVGHVNILR